MFWRKKKYGAFVKTVNGFKQIEDNIAKLSFNDISVHLGYDPFHLHSYHGGFKKRSNIQVVAFEVFTENVVFVLVDDNTKTPTEKSLKRFTKRFNFDEEFDSIFIRDYLLEGIESKSLSIGFFSKNLGLQINDPNGEVLAEKLGVKLFFINGTLASFKLTNDLEEWARHLKKINKDVISNYARLAKKYWQDDYDMIFREVNIQSESFANVPSGYLNEYIPLHKGEFNTINFLMLLVCHYEQKITEYQFKHYNHRRYSELPNYNSKIKKYNLGNFNYFFNSEGKLIDIKQKK